MRFTGFCKFMGAETRKGFKDPSQIYIFGGDSNDGKGINRTAEKSAAR